MPPTLAALDTGTRLAVDRTFLAHERTMMAWVRTAASMISFGFTIYKFFQLELGGQHPPATRLIGPRGFALILIAIGLSALTLAFFEHRHRIRQMRATYGDVVGRSTAGMVGALVAALGMLAIALVMFQQ